MTTEPNTDRDRWLERRRRGIGASDVPGIVGLSPWSSPVDVWVSKIGPVDTEQTEAMRWGLLLEEPIVRAFAEDTGLHVGGQQYEAAHPDNPHHLATLDGLVYETHVDDVEPLGVFEAKFTGDPPWTGGIPDHYACQIQWQLHVTGHHHAWLAALHRAFGRVQFRIYELERDQQVIDVLVAAADRFWTDHVLTEAMPPADGSTASAEALRAIYPSHAPDTHIDLDRDLVDAYWTAKHQADEANRDLERAKQTIQQAMEHAETAYVDGQPAFTWKTSETARIDTKALKQRYPRAIARHTKTATSRRFLAKTIEQKEQAA